MTDTVESGSHPGPVAADEQVIEALRQGDEEAFRRLVKSTTPACAVSRGCTFPRRQWTT